MTGRPLRTRVAVVCSVADQGAVALTNIVVLIVAARLSDAPDFAVFAVVYMVATIALGLSGAYVGQALVLQRGTAVPGACRSALAFVALASGAAGAVALVVLAPLQGAAASASCALALVLPAVLLQDTLRYCWSALQSPQYALGADTLRLSVTLPAMALQPDGSSPARLIAVWGLTALPALLPALWLAGRRTRGARTTPGDHLRSGHLGRRFAVEFGVGNAASQLAVIGLGLLVNPLAVGALRGAATLFGPLNVLCNSLTSFGPPLLSRFTGHRDRFRAAAVVAVVLATTALVWALVLNRLPDRLGRQVLGDTWAAASALLPATGGQYVALTAGTSALLALRVLRPRDTLPVQLLFSLVSVGLLLTGYAVGGVMGAAWGLCAGSALKAVALWARATAAAGGKPTRNNAEGGSDRDTQKPATVHGDGL